MAEALWILRAVVVGIGLSRLGVPLAKNDTIAWWTCLRAIEGLCSRHGAAPEATTEAPPDVAAGRRALDQLLAASERRDAADRARDRAALETIAFGVPELLKRWAALNRMPVAS